mmetsp:Transcript_19403/g.36462  ORF Transcript_19403/g.36462 Transcript_19403/m.36462 type:complete len:88 (+) Transcript_19403:23-286(+)
MILEPSDASNKFPNLIKCTKDARFEVPRCRVCASDPLGPAESGRKLRYNEKSVKGFRLLQFSGQAAVSCTRLGEEALLMEVFRRDAC